VKWGEARPTEVQLEFCYSDARQNLLAAGDERFVAKREMMLRKMFLLLEWH
jgi:hypothetical protein